MTTQADDFRALCLSNGFDPIAALIKMDLHPQIAPEMVLIEDGEGFKLPHTVVNFPDGSAALLEQIAEQITIH